MQPLWGMSFFRWDFLPREDGYIAIQHLISHGWDEKVPTPPSNLHSPLN